MLPGQATCNFNALSCVKRAGLARRPDVKVRTGLAAGGKGDSDRGQRLLLRGDRHDTSPMLPSRLECSIAPANVVLVSGLRWSSRSFQVTLHFFVLLLADLAARVAAFEDVPRRLAARSGRTPATTTAERRLSVASRNRVGHFAPLGGKSVCLCSFRRGGTKKGYRGDS